MTPYEFKTKPTSYQLEAFNKALKYKRFGIFFQQRVGKTKVAVDVACALATQGKNRTLIVSPLSVRGTWIQQIREHSPIKCNIKLCNNIADVSIFNKIDTKGRANFLVINYDMLKPAMTTAILKEFKPNYIVFDEVHLVKNRNSNRSKGAFKLSKDVEYVTGLTGTPIPKAPHDLFAIFRAINSKVFGVKWSDFETRFCVQGGYMNHEIVGHRNLDELESIVARNSIRVLRKDVMKEPVQDDIVVDCPLELKAERLYRELKHDGFVTIDGHNYAMSETPATKIMRLQQLTGGFVVGDNGKYVQVSTAKLKALIDLVRTHCVEANEKLFVLARFTAEINAVSEALEDLHIKHVTFTGKNDEDTNIANREQFQKDPATKVLVMQMDTGGMGITLDTANVIVYYSMSYRLDSYLQSRDRVMGRGQKSDCITRYYLCCGNKVDKKVFQVLQKNEDVAKAIADNTGRFLDDNI